MVLWLASSVFAAEVWFEVSVDGATSEGGLTLVDGVAATVPVGSGTAVFTLQGERLAVVLSDADGKRVASPVLALGSGEATWEVAGPGGLARLDVHVRDDGDDDPVCEALRAPTVGELTAALARARARGEPRVFAGIGTVVTPTDGRTSRTTAEVTWVCTW